MYCKELNKEFQSKAKMFAELKANKKMLMLKKKSEVKCKRNEIGEINLIPKETIKAIPDMEKGFIYPVISNTNFLDSHGDVHLNGSMQKTAMEQNGKVFYLADHKMEVDSIIATPKNVNVSLKSIAWNDLGLPHEGKTEALIYKIDESKIMHEKALKLIKDKEPMQNSIRMQYVKIDLALNSTDEEFEKEYKTWSEVYPKLANKEDADEQGYFWAVRELKLINEGSMVLLGSNSATPIDTKTEAANSTSQDEPSFKDTQITVTEMLQKINV